VSLAPCRGWAFSLQFVCHPFGTIIGLVNRLYLYVYILLHPAKKSAFGDRVSAVANTDDHVYRKPKGNEIPILAIDELALKLVE
jgi:hypothetical protein